MSERDYERTGPGGGHDRRTFLKRAAAALPGAAIAASIGAGSWGPLAHGIDSNNCVTIGNPWHHKYIFPNNMLPSIAQLGRAVNFLFVMEDWHNFGANM